MGNLHHSPDSRGLEDAIKLVGLEFCRQQRCLVSKDMNGMGWRLTVRREDSERVGILLDNVGQVTYAESNLPLDRAFKYEDLIVSRQPPIAFISEPSFFLTS